MKKLWVLLFGGALVGLLMGILGHKSHPAPTPFLPVGSTMFTPFPAFVSARPVYNFSVKPGGVYSAADAGLPRGHAEVLKKDTWAFVSYKRHGQIFWTKHLVLLHAGETMYIDGDKIVRGRCGNGVSFIPKAPVEPVDISEQLDMLEIPVQSPPTVTELTGPLGGAPEYIVPPMVGYSDSSAPPITVPTPPVYWPGGGVQPVAVPEPAEIVFIGMAIFGLTGAVVRKFKR